MGFVKRAGHILSKTISIVVIVLSIGLLTIVWIVQDDISASAVAIFAQLDNVAQMMRNGIAKVEPEIQSLSSVIDQVETASEEIAENVSEEGVLFRLLPQSLVDTLTTSSQSLRDNFNAVYDLLEATSDVLLAVDRMPFVDIPEQGLTTIATLQESMEEIVEQAETFRADIIEFRSEAGARISQITAAAVFLGDETDAFLSDLNQIDADLETIQTQAKKFMRLTPVVVITTAILLSLLSVWIVYSQVIIFTRSASLQPKKSEVLEEPAHSSHQEENLSQNKD